MVDRLCCSLAIGLIILLGGCHHDQSSRSPPVTSVPPASSNGNGAILGATLVRVREPSGFATAEAPRNLRTYGRLEFNVSFVQTAFAREARLNDGSLLDRLWRSLLREVNPTARHVALTVSPEVNGASLGEIVLFTISVNDRNDTALGGGPRLTTLLNEQTETPWFQIDNTTAFRYRINARATTSTGVNIRRELGEVTSALSAIGAGPTSGLTTVIGIATLPVVGRFADRASSVLNGAFSSEAASTATATLGPRNTSNENDGRFWREDRILIRANDGSDLAVLGVDLVFAPTLASLGRERRTPSPDAGLAPTPNDLIAELRIPVEGAASPQLLARQIPDHGPLDRLDREARRNPPDPVVFTSACLAAQDYGVGQLGLTPPDALRLRFELVQRAGFTSNPVLQSSDCFSSDDREALRRMGKRPDRNTAVPRADELLNEAAMLNLVQLLRGIGGSSDLFNQQLARTVEINAPAGALGDEAVVRVGEAAVDRGDVVADFLRGRAAEVGCFGNPGSETGRPQRLDRRLLFAPANPRSGPMTLTLVVADDGRSVVAIQANPASEELIRGACSQSPITRDRLLAAIAAPGSAVSARVR